MGRYSLNMTGVLFGLIVGGGVLLLDGPYWAAYLGLVIIYFLISVPFKTGTEVKEALEADEIDLSKRMKADFEASDGTVEIHVRTNGTEPWGVIEPVEKDGVRQARLNRALDEAVDRARREIRG